MRHHGGSCYRVGALEGETPAAIESLPDANALVDHYCALRATTTASRINTKYYLTTQYSEFFGLLPLEQTWRVAPIQGAGPWDCRLLENYLTFNTGYYYDTVECGGENVLPTLALLGMTPLGGRLAQFGPAGCA